MPLSISSRYKSLESRKSRAVRNPLSGWLAGHESINFRFVSVAYFSYPSRSIITRLISTLGSAVISAAVMVSGSMITRSGTTTPCTAYINHPSGYPTAGPERECSRPALSKFKMLCRSETKHMPSYGMAQPADLARAHNPDRGAVSLTSPNSCMAR